MTATLTPAGVPVPGHTPDLEHDVDLPNLKRELAAAKNRFLKLAQDAERTRREAAVAETQARTRLTAAAELVADALAQPDGPALRLAMQKALAQLRA